MPRITLSGYEDITSNFDDVFDSVPGTILNNLNEDFRINKTGNIKIDMDGKTAIVYLNIYNPKNDNYEEVLIHELCHLKLWKLDQYCESLLDSSFTNKDSKEYKFGYNQFMCNLEQTTQELTKTYVNLIAKNKKLSFVRCEQRMPYREE